MTLGETRAYRGHVQQHRSPARHRLLVNPEGEFMKADLVIKNGTVVQLKFGMKLKQTQSKVNSSSCVS